MKRKKLLLLLDQLSDLEYCLLVWYLRWLVLRRYVREFRPIHMLPVMTVFQLLLFVRFVGYDLNLPFYVAGNVAVVCAALIPMTLRKPYKAHWV